MNTYRFWLPLISLDDFHATFQNAETQVMVKMQIEHWVKIGRPGAIEISPMAAPG